MVDASMPNCAVDFHPGAYTMDKRRILGRMSAGKGFLSGFVRHSGVDTFYCHCQQLEHFSQFTALVTGLGRSDTPVRWIPHHAVEGLHEPGCLYHPDPKFSEAIWRRRFAGQRAYSLCGVNHTVCSAGVMESIGALMVAPVQPWDALICTSQASKDAIEHLLDHWGQYLAVRLKAQPECPIQLPVIPLGVDCDAYEKTAGWAESRGEMRRKMKVEEGDLVALYVGRLTYHAKAHPLPMYVALEAASRRTGKKVHLIEAGWFPTREFQAEFAEAARRWCPSVRIHFVDGRGPDLPSVWQAADLFVSLPDNIQETFGLTPIEAMASGLPQVVSDWNGYRETVRHGIDGFRVPTAMPPGGTGAELARRHYFGQEAYHEYTGCAGLSTAVDVPKCVEALTQLIGNDALRRTMAEAGQRRAREVFDWAVILRAYQELWRELADRRAGAEEWTAGYANSHAHPLHADPFAVFAGYPSMVLGPDSRVSLAPGPGGSRMKQLLEIPMMNFAKVLMASPQECEAVLRRLGEGVCRVADLLEDVAEEQHGKILRTLGWLAKADLIRIEDLAVTPENGGQDAPLGEPSADPAP